MTETFSYEMLQQRNLNNDDTAPGIKGNGGIHERLIEKQTIDSEPEPA